jgi:hypothetical protein
MALFFIFFFGMVFAQYKGERVVPLNRRDFFISSIAEGLSKLSREILKSVDEIKEVLVHYYQPSDLTDFDIFFLSKSYSSTLAKTSYKELAEQARKIGIDPGNKSKVELLKEIFEFEERKKQEVIFKRNFKLEEEKNFKKKGEL